MFSEMDVAEMSFSFFSSFLVVALIPLVLLLIYKSEDKQARYSRLQQQIKDETVIVGNRETTSDNNFKLVQAWGSLHTLQPLRDDLFGLEVHNTLRLSRKVEMF